MRINWKHIKESIAKVISKGLGYIFLSSVFGQVVMFFVSIFIIRKFPKNDYGYYSIAYNLYNYIVVFVGCGLNNAVLQFCSEIRSSDEKKAIYRFCLFTGSAFNLILMFVMPGIAHFFLNTHSKHYFVLMSAWPMFSYISDYFLIQLRVRKENKIFMKTNVYSTVLFCVTAFFLTSRWGIEGYIYSLYAKFIFSIIVSLVLTNRETTNECYESVKLGKKFQASMLKYSLLCCFTNFSSSIMMLLDVTCINFFIGDASVVATYKVATQLPAALMFIPSSITVFIYPYFAENNANIKWVKRNTNNLVLCLLALNGLICTVLYIFAPQIIKVLWGDKYHDALHVLRILILNYLVTGTFNMAFGNVMVALKKVNINFIKTLIFSSTNIILNVIMVKQIGSIGAAYATLIVSILSSAFAGIYFYLWCGKNSDRNINPSSL